MRINEMLAKRFSCRLFASDVDDWESAYNVAFLFYLDDITYCTATVAPIPIVPMPTVHVGELDYSWVETYSNRVKWCDDNCEFWQYPW